MKILSLFLLMTLLPSGQPQAAQDKREKTKETEPELFIPTEKLPADGAISFPVDI